MQQTAAEEGALPVGPLSPGPVHTSPSPTRKGRGKRTKKRSHQRVRSIGDQGGALDQGDIGTGAATAMKDRNPAAVPSTRAVPLSDVVVETVAGDGSAGGGGVPVSAITAPHTAIYEPALPPGIFDPMAPALPRGIVDPMAPALPCGIIDPMAAPPSPRTAIGGA